MHTHEELQSKTKSMCQSNYSSTTTLTFIMVLIMLSKWSWTNDGSAPKLQINLLKNETKTIVVDKLQVNRRKIVPRIRLNRVTFPTNEALTTIIAARKKNPCYCIHTHIAEQKNVNQNILRLSRKQSFLIIRIVCVCVSCSQWRSLPHFDFIRTRWEVTKISCFFGWFWL